MTVKQLECYSRWQGVHAGRDRVDGIHFIGPTGVDYHRPVFRHQPVEFTYDEHGYEIITCIDDPVWAARFTPDRPGEWHYAWMARGGIIQQDTFICVPSEHPGYVEISQQDPRYFAYTNGAPYVPIGLNLCRPEHFALSTGQEFKIADKSGTLGAREFDRWFRSLATNGGNFARLWLGDTYFQVETEVAGEHTPLRFGALDRVVESARHQGIRLKLCLEHFRYFGDGSFPSRVLRHPTDGRMPEDMDTWFQSPDWQELWQRKLTALLARYGDDPVVMAWELWNEINCCATSSFHVQENWTRTRLREVKAASPRNLVVNSLGSFDHSEFQTRQNAFKMSEMDFQQVHRYLDQGAALPVCRTDPVMLSIDAVQRARCPDRPILLAETGAVNDNHSGPFRYYRADHDGLIFHDTTYPAFFAGAAGSGHIWHWDRYVDQKNLWYGFRALADALRGVAVDREDFALFNQSTDEYWCLGLRGRTISLVWLRNRADRWDRVMRDDLLPPAVTTAQIDLAGVGLLGAKAELFRPWPADGTGAVITDCTTAIFPAFRHGLLCRFRKPQAVTGSAQ